MKKVIAIDHGNNMIKSTHFSFPSGYMESDHLPHLGGDVLVYKDKEYTLSEKRLVQKNDKTVDDSFFILTLFAVGKEILKDLENAGVNPVSDEIMESSIPEPVSLGLLVGLPPLHYKAMYKNFEKYFTGREQCIQFELNNRSFAVKIESVQAFPQAYAAALTVYDQIKDSQIVNVVDLGGYTVDCLQLVSLQPNMSVCTSLYMGVNILYQRINEQVRATGAQNIHESVIESILLNDWNTLGNYSESRIALVKSNAERFACEILAEVAQTGLDLTEDKTVFVGGGSILLKEYLNKAEKATRAVFVDDLHANAKGYHIIYDNRKQDHG